MTLWKWLTRAVREGLVEQDGEGTRKDPYRNALPGMRDVWQQRFLETFLKTPVKPPPKP